MIETDGYHKVFEIADALLKSHTGTDLKLSELPMYIQSHWTSIAMDAIDDYHVIRDIYDRC